MLRVLFLVLFISINVHAQMIRGMDAEEKACPPSFSFGGGPMWSSVMADELLMYMTKSEGHPFEASCFAVSKGDFYQAKSMNEHYKLSVYDKHLPAKTKSGAPLKNFFKDLKEKIRARIADSRKTAKESLECLKTRSPNACMPVSVHAKFRAVGAEDFAKVKYNFEALVMDTRFNLILSSSQPGWLSKVKDDPRVLNLSMDNKGVHKEVNWAPATGAEMRLARQTLNGYFDDANKSTGKSIGSARVQSLVNMQRQYHQQVYTIMMGLHPYMQYLKSAKPDKTEIQGALNKLLKSLDEEEKWLNNITKSLDTYQPIDNDILKLLLYRNEVHTVLAKRDDYCGISGALENLRKARNLGKDIAITLPVLFASIAAPYASLPIRTAALGITATGNVGASAYLSYMDQVEINEAKFSAIGRFGQNEEEKEFVNILKQAGKLPESYELDLEQVDAEMEYMHSYENLNELTSARDWEIIFGVMGGYQYKEASQAMNLARSLKLAPKIAPVTKPVFPLIPSRSAAEALKKP